MDNKPTFEQRTAKEFRQDVVMLLVILVIVCTAIFLFADTLKWVIVHASSSVDTYIGPTER